MEVIGKYTLAAALVVLMAVAVLSTARPVQTAQLPKAPDALV